MVLSGSDAISSFLVSIQVSYKYIFLLFVRLYYNYIPWLGLFFYQLNTSEGHVGRGDLNWENVSIRLPCRQVCGIFSWLTFVMEGSSSLWVVPPWTGGSEFYKKQTEKDINSKPVHCTLPWPPFQFLTPCSCPEFLPWLPLVTDCNL